MAQSLPSSIVPAGSTLVNVRDGNPTFSSVQIEIFHIFCFLFIIMFISGYKYWHKRFYPHQNAKIAPETGGVPSLHLSEVG